MAEVGLLPFARVALEVAAAVLPRYRSRFSKHQFSQPQLLAVLCVMRYEDWTFRETEVWLREHRELRRVLQLQSVPDYTTLYHFLKRLDEPIIDQALGEAARRMGNTNRPRGHGTGAGSGEHVLRAPYVSSYEPTAALAALAEVAGGGRCRPAIVVVPDGPPRSWERRWESARLGRGGQPANADRLGAGRRRIRQ